MPPTERPATRGPIIRRAQELGIPTDQPIELITAQVAAHGLDHPAPPPEGGFIDSPVAGPAPPMPEALAEARRQAVESGALWPLNVPAQPPAQAPQQPTFDVISPAGIPAESRVGVPGGALPAADDSLPGAVSDSTGAVAGGAEGEPLSRSAEAYQAAIRRDVANQALVGLGDIKEQLEDRRKTVAELTAALTALISLLEDVLAGIDEP